ncbi:PREDICTED: mRNAion factor [Prunus dulcis]|uniref:PREDICTED: mRNAion factor n=1 Tax=Prunus dulcis TaxID=3755 RepID=A0A5E4E8L6_PRUDU|nr:transcription factor 25 isoform X2 [Prunus dulcis]VVA12143.1 PREDICTED: mRNAion factor [Prunus dulcis]
MSGRLLKKVLKEQEEDQRIESDHEEEEEEEEAQQLNGKASINPFDLLNDDDHDLDHQEDESETFDEPSIVPQLKTKVGGVVSTSNQKSKKKKKKKGKEVSSSSSTSNVEKPLDAILESLSLDAPGKSADTKDCDNLGKPRAPSTLQVDPKFLNAENEMRRIFGSKVVRSFEKHERSGSSRMARGGRRSAYIPRKTILITPSEHWPRWDGSLSMEFLHVSEGYHHFRYVHSSSYRQAQSEFEAAKAIHDINAIASVLLYHPYHLDSLITVAEYYKFTGEHQMSAELISKCLYALECAWNPMFTPLQGNCQVKYSYETNKPLFTVLFTHMKNMDMRGCHRCALEVCKLLLSLDSDDPMGAMFCVDYFSLRSMEYAWLERFSEEYKSDNSLWLFPNFSYSLAICRSYLEREEPSKDALVKTAKATSTDLMKQALMLHPTVLKKLVDKVPLKDKVWADILKNAFFRADQVGIPSLDHLINIYVERNSLIWRLPELQNLLRDAAQLVIERLRHNSSDKKDWACVRKEAFSSEKNEYAHLLVSDFASSAPSAPPEVLQHFMLDPRMRDAAQHPVGDPMEGGHAPRNVANRNTLAVLLESMLPWVHYGDGDGGVEEENQLNGHGAGNE